jgi:DNA-binding NarL/FixJ family response regulator
MFYRPDVVLMDVVMPELDGIAALREIIDQAPDQLVIILTGSKDADLGLIGLRAGAAGHLTKDLEIDSLPRVIAGALAGEAAISRQMTMRLVEHLRQIPEHAVGVRPVKSRLTSREWEVLDLLAERLTNDEIAQRLVLSTETVRTHLKNVFKKLEVKSREEAVEAAGRMRIFGDPD